ncbi:MAG: hypothetical protein OEX02_17465, partial [Cyclobacteriaceae bacterium]|nr:hypothetical protein [Cyclobacteriaceae bacterium]
GLDKVPDEAIPYDASSISIVDSLLQLGEKELALEITEVYGNRIIDEIDFHISEGMSTQNYVMQRNMSILSLLQRSLLKNGEAKMADKLYEAYQESNRKMGGGFEG